MENKEIIVFDLEKTKTYDENGQFSEGVCEIGIENIIPNPNQPRKTFDQKSLKELSNSIKRLGVLQPIIVTKNGIKYEIVAGERRYRASKMANLEKVPCIIRDLTKSQIDEIAIIENIQRQNLNPIEEAKAYKKFLDKYNLTQDELADRMGKSRPTITNAIRLLALPEEIQQMVISGRLSSGHARALIPITRLDEQLTLAKAACDKQISVRQLEKMVHNRLNPNDIKTIKPVLPVEIKRLINTMQRVFATNVKAIGNNNKGRIYIDYYTQDDLDRIIELVDILRKDKNLD